MTQLIQRLFLNHPAHVEESYGEHAKFAFGFSVTLFAAAFAALAHGIIPGLFEKTASKKINELHSRMHNRK